MPISTAGLTLASYKTFHLEPNQNLNRQKLRSAKYLLILQLLAYVVFEEKPC